MSELTRTQGKAARLGQIERMLWAFPHGLTQAEIARRCGVHRSTIHRSLQDLADEGIPTWEAADGRIGIDRNEYLTAIKLRLDEAMAVYMAARLLARYSDKPNRHTVEALLKLGLALEPSSPQVARHILHTSEALREAQAGQPSDHQQRLEVLTRAWSQGRKVRLRYSPLRSRRSFEEVFAPYFLEPSAIGYSTYVIGRSDLVGKLRTRKVERIEQVALTDEAFEIPSEFDPARLLAGAWGVWFDEEDAPTPVTLKFSPAVARRVQESRWHPSQRVEAQTDGGLLWHAELDAVEEFVWWVRGWGAECEVVEPKGLREEIVAHLLRAIKIYNPATTYTVEDSKVMDIFQQYLTLPGKTEPKLTIFEHSGDVFQIACYLLETNSKVVTDHLLVKAGALLHDVGKIEQDIKPGKRWIHQPHSSKYLRPLIDHPRMKTLLADNKVDLSKVKYDDLLLICEHHHDIPTQPALLRRAPDALLVSVADVIASALEAGWLGEIRPMLAAGTYIDLNISLLENLELASGLNSEIHRVDLPGDSTSDALLNDLIFRDMAQRLPRHGLKPIMQKRSSLWVVAQLDDLRAFMKDYTVDPRGLYQSAGLEDEIYEQILAQLPAPGSLSFDSLKYVLVNERIARKVALSLVDRRTAREALEHFGVSRKDVHEAFDRAVDAESPNDSLSGQQ
jgi:predicted DNA-binding transcriptional regulator YafY